MPKVDVLVLATVSDFDARCYLLANPDVAAAGVDAATHFKEYGSHEGRSQINPELMRPNGYRARKFQRFREHLNFPGAADASAFPIAIGDRHFSLDQYQGESANADFPPFVETIRDNPDKVFMDLGCGLRQQVHENCLYVEVYPSIAADLIVPPTCIYSIKDETFDGIGCFAVLEHTRMPWQVVQEMRRMLKPGGQVWIDWPFLQPVHGYPSHYYNATREGVRALFEDAGFVVQSLETLPFQGPDYTISWVLGEFLKRVPEQVREHLMNMSVRDILSNPPQSEFWQNLLAEMDDTTLSTFACGNTLVAYKK